MAMLETIANLRRDKLMEAVKNAWQPTALPSKAEAQFQQWWNEHPDVQGFKETFQQKFGEAPNPNDKMFDYRGAFVGGVVPQMNPDDGLYHWSSKTPDGKWLKNPFLHPTAGLERLSERGLM